MLPNTCGKCGYGAVRLYKRFSTVRKVEVPLTSIIVQGSIVCIHKEGILLLPEGFNKSKDVSQFNIKLDSF